jgi:structural maintenance of chromosome 3 (chondroitin sulfate proteoglycan 6)
MEERYAKENDINCITMDGDQVNRKGAMTGGYHDVRFSKLEAHKAMRVWISELKRTWETGWWSVQK